MNDTDPSADRSVWNDPEFVRDVSSGRFGRAEQVQVTPKQSHRLKSEQSQNRDARKLSSLLSAISLRVRRAGSRFAFFHAGEERL